MTETFIVTFTPEAKVAIAEEAEREGYSKPGVMIHRQGPRGEITRTPDGRSEWNVERPHPWRAQVGDFKSFGEDPTDVRSFEDVLVWLALVPWPGEGGVQVSLREGELFAEPITSLAAE